MTMVPPEDRDLDVRIELPGDGRADRACRPDERGPEGWAFTILLLMPVPIILALMLGSGTPPPHAMALLGMILVVSAVSLWTVVRLLWEPFRRRFPAVHPTERVRWKRLQAIRLGLFGGFNYCVDVGADDEHVHLHLMAPFGWAARPMSIPRAAIEIGDEPKRMMGLTRVRLLGQRCWLPTWAVERTGLRA